MNTLNLHDMKAKFQTGWDFVRWIYDGSRYGDGSFSVTKSKLGFHDIYLNTYHSTFFAVGMVEAQYVLGIPRYINNIAFSSAAIFENLKDRNYICLCSPDARINLDPQEREAVPVRLFVPFNSRFFDLDPAPQMIELRQFVLDEADRKFPGDSAKPLAFAETVHARLPLTRKVFPA